MKNVVFLKCCKNQHFQHFHWAARRPRPSCWLRRGWAGIVCQPIKTWPGRAGNESLTIFCRASFLFFLPPLLPPSSSLVLLLIPPPAPSLPGPMAPFLAWFLAFMRSLWVAGPARRPPKKRFSFLLLAKNNTSECQGQKHTMK